MVNFERKCLKNYVFLHFSKEKVVHVRNLLYLCALFAVHKGQKGNGGLLVHELNEKIVRVKRDKNSTNSKKSKYYKYN